MPKKYSKSFLFLILITCTCGWTTKMSSSILIDPANNCPSAHHYFVTELIIPKNICNLMTLSADGDFALESKNYEDAFQFYSKGLSLPGLSSMEQAILYSKRVLASTYMRPLQALQYKNNKRGENYLATVYSIALGDAQNCARLRPDWWTCYYLLGQVYRLQKNFPAAHTAYNQALGLHPGSHFIKNVRDACKAEAGGQSGVDKEEAMWKKLAEEFNEQMWKERRDEVIKFIENKVNSPLLETYKRISRDENLKIAALGQVLIGNLYSSGTEGIQINYKVAAAWYKLAAEIENPEAIFKVALLYLDEDPHAAVDMLQKLANTPHPPGYWEEERFRVDWGEEEDGGSKILTEKKTTWIAKSQSMLGKLFMDGGILPVDHGAAAKWLQKAVDNGDGKAAYYLAQMYMEGIPQHMDKNLDKAIQYFQMASWRGVSESKFPLAQIYLKKFDINEAEQWFDAAIVAGDEAAHSRKKEFKTLLNKTKSKLRWIGLGNLGIKVKDDPDTPIAAPGGGGHDVNSRMETEFEAAIIKFWAMDSRIRKMASKPNHTYAQSIVRSMDHLKRGRKLLFDLTTLPVTEDVKIRRNLEQEILQELANSIRITSSLLYLTQKELTQVEQILDKVFFASSSLLGESESDDVNARIIHACLKRIGDEKELIQFLRMSILKYPREPCFHLLLTYKLASIIDIQGSFLACGKGMVLFPEAHDLIFHHIVLVTILQNQDDSLSKRERVEVLKKMFSKFLETAPPDHKGVPFIYYSLAELSMREEENERSRMDKYAAQWWSTSEIAEAIQELRDLRQNVTQLFEKGVAAEEMLIPPFLPIQFGGSIKVMLQEYLEDGGQSGKMFTEHLDDPWYAHLDDDDDDN